MLSSQPFFSKVKNEEKNQHLIRRQKVGSNQRSPPRKYK